MNKSFEDGFAAFDLLAPLHPYKMEFAAQTIAVHDYAVARSLRGRLYAAMVLSGRRHAKNAVARLPVSLRLYGASLLAVRAALQANARRP